MFHFDQVSDDLMAHVLGVKCPLYLVSKRRASSLSKLADTEAAIVIGVLIVAVSPLAGM